MKKHSALGEKNKNKAGLRFFFSSAPRRKSADFAAELLRGCRIKLTGRLSCFSSLLHPTFYLCSLWTFGWMNTADVATSRCSTAPCLCTCRRAGRRRFRLTWRRINFPIKHFNQSNRPPCVQTHAKVISITHHMNGVCKNERPFQARLVRHDDHCAPLHVCASLPGF